MFRFILVSLALFSSVCFAEIGFVTEIVVTNAAASQLSKPVVVKLNTSNNEYVFCGIVATNYIERATNLLTAAMISKRRVELDLTSNGCINSVGLKNNLGSL